MMALGAVQKQIEAYWYRVVELTGFGIFKIWTYEQEFERLIELKVNDAYPVDSLLYKCRR